MTIFTTIYGMIIYDDLGSLPLKWYILILIINLLLAYNATLDYNSRVKLEGSAKKDYFFHPYTGTKNNDTSLKGLIKDIFIGMPQMVIFYAILFGHYSYVTKGFWFY